MREKPPKKKMRKWAWKWATKLFGDHPELFATRTSLEQMQWQLESEQAKIQEVTQRLEADLEKVREEKLQIMAKEAVCRNELQDCQARSKDLLEQVVVLTHKQRQTKQNLLDQQFKTETTPLERNRFEMDLAEARGNSRRAEERAKRAEENLARLKGVEKRAARAKELESQLAWMKQKSEAFHLALAAALEKVRELEEKQVLPKAHRAAPTRRKKMRRTYHKPKINSKKDQPQG